MHLEDAIRKHNPHIIIITHFFVIFQYQKYLPSRVATHARMASRAAVLRPGDGSVDC